MIKVSQILDKLGISYKEMGEDYRVACWFHDENIPSMSIHKEGGYYYCFSCKRSGNIFGILKQFLDLEGIDAIKFLSSFDIGEKTIEDEEQNLIDLKNKLLKGTKKKLIRQPVIQIPTYVQIESHPYLINRGLTTTEIIEWGMGVVEDEPYRGWILIPIYQEGILRTYFLRSTTNDRKRYGKFPRMDILVGIDKAWDITKPIYVVEGIFDMIFLQRTGVQVVASLSNRLHHNVLIPQQIERLTAYSHIVIVPDADIPGLQLVKDSLPLLYNSSVGVCSLPEGKKDTAMCSTRELFQVLKSEKPLLNFMIGGRYLQWNLKALHPQTLHK